MSCIKGDRAYHMPDGYVDDKTIEAQILKQKQEEERLFNQKLEKDNLLKQQKEKEDAAFEIWWDSCSKEEKTELIEKKNQGIWFFRNKIDFDSIIDLQEIRNSEKPCLSNMILLQNIKDYFLENVFPYLNCAENLPIQVEEG